MLPIIGYEAAGSQQILETHLLTWSRHWGPFLFMGMMLAIMAATVARRYWAFNEARPRADGGLRSLVNLVYGLVLLLWIGLAVHTLLAR